MDKAALKEILANAEKTSITIVRAESREICLFVGGERVLAEAKEVGEKAIKAGHTVIWQDGTKEWVSVDPVWVEREDGGYELEFHPEDGDRVRVIRKRVTLAEGGERVEVEEGRSWRAFETVFPD